MTKREERARALLRELDCIGGIYDEADVAALVRFADEVRAEALREAAARILDTTSRGSAHEGLILANRVVNDMADRLTPAEKPAPVTYRAGTVPPVVHVGMWLRTPNGCEWRVSRLDPTTIVFGVPGSVEYYAAYGSGWPLARDWTEPGGGGACRCGAQPPCGDDGIEAFFSADLDTPRANEERGGACGTCEGWGWPGSDPLAPCPTCNGTGRGGGES